MDILQRKGGYPLPPGASTVLGVEFSGHISEIGPGVTEWKVNDEVFGLASGGAYAEYIKLPASHLIAKPAHLSWIEAASVPEMWITAYQALVVIGKVKAGDNVLVHAGASGVGIAASQLARLYGAKNVIATASSKEKLDCLVNLPGGIGPTHGVNYKTQDFAEEVKKITDGKGANVVIDFVGQSHWHKNIAALAVDGHMTMLGLLSGGEVGSFNLGVILYKRLHIEGSTLRSRSVAYQTELIAGFKRDVVGHLTNLQGSGKLRTIIHSVYNWTDIQAAHQEMEDDKNIGKIVVEIN